MKISIALKVESLLRDLRLTGHALAEGAEQKVLRAGRREGGAVQRILPPATGGGGTGGEA